MTGSPVLLHGALALGSSRLGAGLGQSRRRLPRSLGRSCFAVGRALRRRRLLSGIAGKGFVGGLCGSVGVAPFGVAHHEQPECRSRCCPDGKNDQQNGQRRIPSVSSAGGAISSLPLPPVRQINLAAADPMRAPVRTG